MSDDLNIEEGISHDQVVTPVVESVQEAAPVEEPQIRDNLWGAQKHYECRLCNFDTFNRASMLEHLVEIHNSELALAELVELENSNGGN